MSLLGALGSKAADMGINYFETQAANNFSKAQANRQMNFQQYNSDTAHRREMEDLKAAGLNPILTATGGAGASSPSGASGSTFRADTADFDPMMFANLKQAKATTENTHADTGLKAANTASAKKSLELADEQKKLLQAQSAKEGELARSAKQSATLLDKYGEASQVMGLVNSGTGSIGNLLGVGGLLKGLLNGNKTKNIFQENYSPSGEHRGTTHKRIYND